MKKLDYEILIDAPREVVWQTLWDDTTYRQWTSAFNENSYAETDWKEGSKVLFLDGSGSGMVARIAKNVPNEYMSIEHLGMIENNVEDLDSEKVKSWAGAHENYLLKTVDSKTKLAIELDVAETSENMMNEMWPKALQRLKEISENRL